MISITASAVTLAIVLLIACVTPACGATIDGPPLIRPTGAATTRTSRAGTVLVIPSRDCRDASLVLARVTRHIRDAEQSAWYSPEAEDEYDDALQAILETRCAKGIEDLHAADRSLLQGAGAEFLIDSDDVR